MPQPLDKVGCVSLDSETGLMVGGRKTDGNFVKSIYTFESKTGTFTQANNLDTPTNEMQCGKVKSGNETLAICTGGWDGAFVSRTYWFNRSTWRLVRKMEWDLPSPEIMGRLVTSAEGRLYMVNRDDSVLEFTVEEKDGKHWHVMDWEVGHGNIAAIEVDLFQDE